MLTLFTPCLFNLVSVHIHTIENLLQKPTSNFFPSKQKFKFDNYTSRGTKLLIYLYLHMYYFIVQARHLELILRTDRIYSHNLNINVTFFLVHICHIFKFQRTYKRFLCILAVWSTRTYNLPTSSSKIHSDVNYLITLAKKYHYWIHLLFMYCHKQLTSPWRSDHTAAS
jgi:hypothetical protein